MSVFDGMAAIFTRHLGEDGPIPYTPVIGLAFTLPAGHAIYHEEALTGLEDDGSAGVDAVRRTLHLQAADVPNPVEGDRVTVRGVTYRVAPPIARDGKGMVVVTLTKV
jgi:hypothetical protein